jgi:ribosomal-protein-alanine N-acetyltransferase
MIAPPLRIRNYQKKDLEVLHRIDRICFPEDIAFSLEELSAYFNHPGSIARVAEDSARKLGFILAHVQDRSHAHLLTLDVVPEARRRGIGTSLMGALHRELKVRGIGAAVLEVGVRNAAARRLYESLQYQYLGILPGYYRQREDAYRMIRLFVRETDPTDIRPG